MKLKALAGPALAMLVLSNLNAWAQTEVDALPDEVLAVVAEQLPETSVTKSASSGDLSLAEIGFKALSTTGTQVDTSLSWSNSVIPFRGPEVDKVNVVESGVLVEKFWSELAPDTRRSMLSNSYTSTTVFEVKSGGNLSIIPITADLKRKNYSLVFNNFRYKDYPCSAANPGAGRLLVGVGLRVEARVKVKEDGIGIGLPKLALAASKSKLEGFLESHIIGMATSPTLNEVVTAATANVSYDALVKAATAYSVANALLESNEFLAVPHVVGYSDGAGPGSCLAAMRGESFAGPIQ